MQQRIIDIRAGKPYPAGALSNFAKRSFIFRMVPCNSMEGLLQSLKYKDTTLQKQMCALFGVSSKRKGYGQDWWTEQTLYWNGQPMKRDGEEYQHLLDEAFVSLFTQNVKARDALFATGTDILKHTIGKREQNSTILTQHEFCSRLTDIREILVAKQRVSF